MKGDQGGDREAPFHAPEHSGILQAQGLAAHTPLGSWVGFVLAFHLPAVMGNVKYLVEIRSCLALSIKKSTFLLKNKLLSPCLLPSSN